MKILLVIIAVLLLALLARYVGDFTSALLRGGRRPTLHSFVDSLADLFMQPSTDLFQYRASIIYLSTALVALLCVPPGDLKASLGFKGDIFLFAAMVAGGDLALLRKEASLPRRYPAWWLLLAASLVAMVLFSGDYSFSLQAVALCDKPMAWILAPALWVAARLEPRPPRYEGAALGRVELGVAFRRLAMAMLCTVPLGLGFISACVVALAVVASLGSSDLIKKQLPLQP